MKNKAKNWRYYLQFIMPLKFKSKYSQDMHYATTYYISVWWMFLGKTFFERDIEISKQAFESIDNL